MRILFMLGVVAAAVAHPLPDDCALLVGGAVPYAATHAIAHAPVAYAAPAQVAYAAPAQVAYAAPAQVAYAPPAQVAYAPPAQVAYAAPAHVSYAAPAPVAYAAPAHVALPPAEVKVPVTQTHVEVPIHKQVHYGTQSYVSGSTTSIHKPALAAPAIAPPSTLLSKISYNAPEVTVQHQEVPVEKHTPNYVEKPYHAGSIIKYTAPEVKEIKVPTPYAKPVPVPHPVPVAQPVPVPVAQPVALAQHVAVAQPAPVVLAAADCDD